MKCILCDKKMEPIFDDSWELYQPKEGCEVQIIGAYGSEFDLTMYRGVICDSCVKKVTANMDRSEYA